ncbi:MAG: 23S rRNA (guanosine(2251)-2'-O)-methyltransferase RlmB, partial [Agathobacter sp.]|nr:23S rRNA (guanosine(2251)-2'-O)-methyltransferase RlmB [Agathobacter sp.]
MITSTSNPQVKNLTLLVKKAKERKNQGVFVVEGTKMVMEAPTAWVKQVYVSETYEKATEHGEDMGKLRQKGVAIETLSDSVFKSVSDTQTPQGILAVVA